MNTEDPGKIVRWVNTILLSIILTCGGAFSAWLGSRSISQGETLVAIQASQVTRAEVETKLIALKNEVTNGQALISAEQIALRAKLTAIEIQQAAVAAALLVESAKKVSHP